MRLAGLLTSARIPFLIGISEKVRSLAMFLERVRRAMS